MGGPCDHPRWLGGALGCCRVLAALLTAFYAIVFSNESDWRNSVAKKRKKQTKKAEKAQSSRIGFPRTDGLARTS